MKYVVSFSKEYLVSGAVVIREIDSVPPGRILCIVTRENQYEAEQTAQYLCDLLNKDL